MNGDWEFKLGTFGGGNYVLEADDFYISYNSKPGGGIGLFQGDDGGDETAICKDGVFYILNGDFRDEYAAIIDQGFDICVDFYQKHEAKQSSWSTERSLESKS